MAKTRARLRQKTLAPDGARLLVDREHPGKILGASIATVGPALGHGFELDAETIKRVAEYGEGVRGRWTHGGLTDDGIGKHLGRWENTRVEGDQALGDFVFAESAHKIQPDGISVPAPVYLMDRAEEDPASFGVSVVADFGHYQPPAREGEDPRTFARLEAAADLRRADFVADPAANPTGLHAGTNTPSALTEEGERQIRRLVGRVGVDDAHRRAQAFLARTFAGLGLEQEDDGMEEKIKELEAALATRDTELGETKAALAALREAEDARTAKEQAAYLSALKAQAVELQSPIPEDDLTRVRACFDRGDDETAHTLGEAFLSRSKALGTPIRHTTETVTLGEPDDDKAHEEHMADFYRRNPRLKK